MNWGNPTSRRPLHRRGHARELRLDVAHRRRRPRVGRQQIRLLSRDLDRGFVVVGILLALLGLWWAWRHRRGRDSRCSSRSSSRGPPSSSTPTPPYPDELTKGVDRALLHPPEHPARDARRARRVVDLLAPAERSAGRARGPASSRPSSAPRCSRPRRRPPPSTTLRRPERQLRRLHYAAGPARLRSRRTRPADARRRELHLGRVRAERRALPPGRRRARHRAARAPELRRQGGATTPTRDPLQVRRRAHDLAQRPARANLGGDRSISSAFREKALKRCSRRFPRAWRCASAGRGAVVPKTHALFVRWARGSSASQVLYRLHHGRRRSPESTAWL